MSSSSADVIVIGAGLSGLQAAFSIQAAGYSVIILEARDLVGGKLWSTPRADGKGIQELGAAWINDSNQSHVWSYCQQFNLTPVIQNIKGSVACQDAQGNCHFFPFGELPNFSQADCDSITFLRDSLEHASLNLATLTTAQRKTLDSQTLEQWCHAHKATEVALRTATVWCRGTLGQDPNEVSALAFMQIAGGAGGIVQLRFDGKHGGQHLRVREGTQAIATGLAGLLSEGTVNLGCDVKTIQRRQVEANDNQTSGYLVTTASGAQYEARKVVISIPSQAYKRISFSPEDLLPSQHRAYASAAHYGTFIKYIVMFKTPWWRALGACGLSQSFKGPINHCRDTSVDEDENYALTCFVTSGPARRWSKQSEEQREREVLSQLGELFGTGYEPVKQESVATLESVWQHDEFAGLGCPFAAPGPGVLGQMGDGEICSPMYGDVCFVGTEFTDRWRGYMEGAMRSGKLGAEKVLASLKDQNWRQ